MTGAAPARAPTSVANDAGEGDTALDAFQLHGPGILPTDGGVQAVQHRSRHQQLARGRMGPDAGREIDGVPEDVTVAADDRAIRDPSVRWRQVGRGDAAQQL